MPAALGQWDLCCSVSSRSCISLLGMWRQIELFPFPLKTVSWPAFNGITVGYFSVCPHLYEGVVDPPVLTAPALIAPPPLPLWCWPLGPARQGQKDLKTKPLDCSYRGEAQWEEVLRLQHQLSNPGPLAAFSCLCFSDPRIQLVFTCVALKNTDPWAKAQKLGCLKGFSGDSNSWAHVETTMVNGSC